MAFPQNLRCNSGVTLFLDVSVLNSFSSLEWVVGHWDETGCDLWEEVRSDDFFWNRMAFIYCLNVAADYSDRIGQTMGDTYRSTADDIKAVVTKHWNGNYLYESENRPDDGVYNNISILSSCTCNEEDEIDNVAADFNARKSSKTRNTLKRITSFMRKDKSKNLSSTNSS